MYSNTLFFLLHEVVILFLAFLIIIPLNGFVRTCAMYHLGDKGSKSNGFFTLNPFAHLNIFSLIIMLFSYVIIGYVFEPLPKGIFFIILLTMGNDILHYFNVPIIEYPPVNFRKFQNPKKALFATIIAEIASNFLFAWVMIFMLKSIYFFVGMQSVALSIVATFSTLIDLSILYGVLNMLPLPPFAALHIVHVMLPQKIADITIALFRKYVSLIYIFLFFIPGISDSFFAILSLGCLIIKKTLIALFLS